MYMSSLNLITTEDEYKMMSNIERTELVRKLGEKQKAELVLFADSDETTPRSFRKKLKLSGTPSLITGRTLSTIDIPPDLDSPDSEGLHNYFSLSDILFHNNIFPIEDSTIRDITDTIIEPHIVIRIVGHGTAISTNEDVDTTAIENVSIFSIASKDEVTYATKMSCNFSPQLLTAALNDNYPIIPTFRAFRAFINIPFSPQTERNIKLGERDNRNNFVAALQNNEFAYLHNVSENMLYASDKYTEGTPKPKNFVPLEIIVHDVRYPKTEVQLDFLKNPKYLNELLCKFNIINYNKELRFDTLTLFDLIRALKMYGFEHIFIFETTCRGDGTINDGTINDLGFIDRLYGYYKEREDYHFDLQKNPDRALWGGRRRKRRTRRTKSSKSRVLTNRRCRTRMRRTR